MCQPCVDRPLQRHVEEIAAGLDHQAQIAHGGEPGVQGGAGVHPAAQRAVRRVVLHTVHRSGQPLGTAGTADEQVQLHVHQTRQQRDVTQIDDCRRIRQRAFGIHRGDAVVRRRRRRPASEPLRPRRRPTVGPSARSEPVTAPARHAVQRGGPGVGTFGCFQHSTGNDTMNHRVQKMHQIQHVLWHVRPARTCRSRRWPPPHAR